MIPIFNLINHPSITSIYHLIYSSTSYSSHISPHIINQFIDDRWGWVLNDRWCWWRVGMNHTHLLSPSHLLTFISSIIRLLIFYLHQLYSSPSIFHLFISSIHLIYSSISSIHLYMSIHLSLIYSSITSYHHLSSIRPHQEGSTHDIWDTTER